MQLPDVLWLWPNYMQVYRYSASLGEFSVREILVHLPDVQRFQLNCMQEHRYSVSLGEFSVREILGHLPDVLRLWPNYMQVHQNRRRICISRRWASKST